MIPHAEPGPRVSTRVRASLVLLIVLSCGSSLSLASRESVAAEPVAPLGTEPLRVSGAANFTFQLTEGTYYLGMASDGMGITLEANLTQGAQTVAEKQVLYWGARRLGLLAGEFQLALSGHGSVIIASDAQQPGSYQFAGFSLASFFLLPQQRTLDIAVLAQGGPTAKVDVLDGLMSSVLSSPPSGESLIVTLPVARDGFAYVVVSASAAVVEGTLRWQSYAPSSPSTSAFAWVVPLAVIAVTAAVAILLRRNRRTRSRRRASR